LQEKSIITQGNYISAYDALGKVYKLDHFPQPCGLWKPLGISYPLLGQQRCMLDVTHPNTRNYEPPDPSADNRYLPQQRRQPQSESPKHSETSPQLGRLTSGATRYNI
jgi:hypothetical protein